MPTRDWATFYYDSLSTVFCEAELRFLLLFLEKEERGNAIYNTGNTVYVNGCPNIVDYLFLSIMHVSSQHRYAYVRQRKE
jgi:hypothetical protein